MHLENFEQVEQEAEEAHNVYAEIKAEQRVTVTENRKIRAHMKDKFDVLTR